MIFDQKVAEYTSGNTKVETSKVMLNQCFFPNERNHDLGPLMFPVQNCKKEVFYCFKVRLKRSIASFGVQF